MAMSSPVSLSCCIPSSPFIIQEGPPDGHPRIPGQCAAVPCRSGRSAQRGSLGAFHEDMG